MKTYTTAGSFNFETPERKPVGSALYDEHLKLTDKSHMAPFAGYIMPLWYSSISAEHRAVRMAAGIFDCTHMGALEVTGPSSRGFLETVITNRMSNLAPGRARYGQILDAAGNVIDDVIVFCRTDENFMVVVNAANDAKVQAYFTALTSDKHLLDAEDPDRKIQYKPAIRDMRNKTMLGEHRVNIAVQGPLSVDVFAVASKDDQLARRLAQMRPFDFIETAIDDMDCLISRTGYTGARVGFEVFFDPDNASKMWRLLLHEGVKVGLVPCGLGSRDSLRVEAGLPLYGHELAGRHNVSPFEAGYGWAVKLDKDFFIGKAIMEKEAASYDMEVLRIELPGEKGVRPAHPEDAILDGEGRCMGWVLSCAAAGKKQYALAYVQRDALKQGDQVGLYYAARRRSQVEKGRKDRIARADVLQADIAGVVAGRFEKF